MIPVKCKLSMKGYSMLTIQKEVPIILSIGKTDVAVLWMQKDSLRDVMGFVLTEEIDHIKEDDTYDSYEIHYYVDDEHDNEVKFIHAVAGPGKEHVGLTLIPYSTIESHTFNPLRCYASKIYGEHKGVVMTPANILKCLIGRATVEEIDANG